MLQVVWRIRSWSNQTVQSDSHGADGRALQGYKKRQIWLRIGNHLKRYEFHVLDVTEPILSVSNLCEYGIETHLVSNTS